MTAREQPGHPIRNPGLRAQWQRMHELAGPARTGPPSGRERLATFAALTVMLVAVSLREGEHRIPDATLLVFTLLAWAPLLVRTRWPRGVLAATSLVESAHLVLVPWLDPDLRSPVPVATYQPVPLATMVAVYTVATRSPRLVAWASGAAATAMLFWVAVLARPVELMSTDLVMAQLVIIATGLGVLVAGRRERAVQLAREREAQKQAAVIAERLRIARELHDVLAHNLALVNAQAGVAHYLLRSDPNAAAAALEGITQHTAQAIDELRATVGLLRYGDDRPDSTATQDGQQNDGAAGQLRPMPTLDRDVDELLDRFRLAGMPLDLVEEGNRRPLSAPTGLTAYRIVQEALTNAAKHAPGAPVQVSLDWSSDGLAVSVRNQASPTPEELRPPAAGSRHGITGMRERARSVHGSLEAGPTQDGGYAVEASIPLN